VSQSTGHGQTGQREDPGIDLTDEVERLAAACDPTPGRLSPDVIVLNALGDGFEVVRLLAVAELPYAQHDRHLPGTARAASRTVVQIRESKSDRPGTWWERSVGLEFD
jgi:hypothetical protein